jgi:hypothetical protein
LAWAEGKTETAEESMVEGPASAKEMPATVRSTNQPLLLGTIRGSKMCRGFFLRTLEATSKYFFSFSPDEDIHAALAFENLPQGLVRGATSAESSANLKEW